MKRLIFTIACLMLTLGMMADEQKKDNEGKPQREGKFQHKQFSPERYYKHMEEYISKEADLTDNEKTKFFPLFKEMLEAQRKIVEQDREVMHSFRTAKTESEFEKIIEKTTSLQVENKKIEQTYYKKFAKVLTWEKICKVRMAQTRFNMRALRNFSPKQTRHARRLMGKPGNHKEGDGRQKMKEKKENKENKQA